MTSVIGVTKATGAAPGGGAVEIIGNIR